MRSIFFVMLIHVQLFALEPALDISIWDGDRRQTAHLVEVEDGYELSINKTARQVKFTREQCVVSKNEYRFEGIYCVMKGNGIRPLPVLMHTYSVRYAESVFFSFDVRGWVTLSIYRFDTDVVDSLRFFAALIKTTRP